MKPGTPLVADEYEIASATANVFAQFYFANYFSTACFQDVEGFDCPGCGGTITFDSLTEDKATGHFSVVLPMLNMDDVPVPSATLTTMSFRALAGSIFDGGSPISQCRALYGD